MRLLVIASKGPKAVPGVVASPAHGARTKSRSDRFRRRYRPGRDRHLAVACRRGAASGGAGRHVSDRSRLQFARRLSDVMGNPELLLDRAVAASRIVGRAVADAGGGADPAEIGRADG